MELQPKENKHLTFRIIEYGLLHDNLFFRIKDLYTDLKLHPKEVELFQNLVAGSLSTANPNHLAYMTTGATNWVDSIVTLLPTAITTYNEYEEIKLARMNAEYAKIQSNKAHKVALWALIISAIVGVIQIYLELQNP